MESDAKIGDKIRLKSREELEAIQSPKEILIRASKQFVIKGRSPVNKGDRKTYGNFFYDTDNRFLFGVIRKEFDIVTGGELEEIFYEI